MLQGNRAEENLTAIVLNEEVGDTIEPIYPYRKARQERVVSSRMKPHSQLMNLGQLSESRPRNPVLSSECVGVSVSGCAVPSRDIKRKTS
jgi:hypothetical protein